MNRPFYTYFFVLLLLCATLCSCYKQYFFEDTDDAGLSRLTSRNYNVASVYINEEPWVTGFTSTRGPYPTTILLATGSAVKDTLYITWDGEFTNTNAVAVAGLSKQFYVTIAVPVKKNFTKADFLGFGGQSFAADSSGVKVLLSPSPFVSAGSYLYGKGKIYFIRIDAAPGNASINFSGLFDGNIGDSILLKKGRFDYSVSPQDYNLQ
jgi:hypothetical protein